MGEFDHEACKAMESVMSKIGDHFGVTPGDVDGLFAAIEAQTTENERLSTEVRTLEEKRVELNVEIGERDAKIERLSAEVSALRTMAHVPQDWKYLGGSQWLKPDSGSQPTEEQEKEVDRVMAMPAAEIWAELVRLGEDPDELVRSTRNVIRRAIAVADSSQEGSLRVGSRAEEELSGFSDASADSKQVPINEQRDAACLDAGCPMEGDHMPHCDISLRAAADQRPTEDGQ